jgi:lipoyl(octanoyl) transferase
MSDAPARVQPTTPKLTLVTAGILAYDRALALQQALHARVAAGEAGAGSGYLITVEHPPVLTFGKNADRKNLLFAPETLRAAGIAVVDTDRGGEVTAHEPGQLVVYPILRLADFNLTARRHVAWLEQAVIRTLAGFGVEAATDPKHPGVWAGQAKICALGVRFKNRISLHGLALNVANDLSLFDRIIPCGIRGRSVTSLTRLLDRNVPVDTVAPRLIDELLKGLGVGFAGTRTAASLQWEE